ncbi:hypothetical protein [Moraxella lacunata]
MAESLSSWSICKYNFTPSVFILEEALLCLVCLVLGKIASHAGI